MLSKCQRRYQMLNFIGRGSAFNYKEGNTSAFYKDDHGRYMLLIDCGELVPSRIAELGLLDGVEVLDIFITHFHPDHSGGLCGLIYYCYFEKKIIPRLIVADSISPTLFGMVFGTHGVEIGMFDMIDKCEAIKKTIPIRHTNDMFTQMLIMNIFSKDIVYTGDTCDSTYLKYFVKTNCDRDITYYVDCCSLDYTGNPHLSVTALCEIFPEGLRGSVYCMHFNNDEAIHLAHENGFQVVYSLYTANVFTVKHNDKWFSTEDEEHYVKFHKHEKIPFYTIYNKKMTSSRVFSVDSITFKV